MNVEALDHVNIITDRLDGTAEFYAELLGLERRDAPPPLTPADRDLDVRCREPGDHPHQFARLLRTYDREVDPGRADRRAAPRGAQMHRLRRGEGAGSTRWAPTTRRTWSSAIKLRQIFTPDPNNVLLELNFFAE